jgi:hypothetical protein
VIAGDRRSGVGDCMKTKFPLMYLPQVICSHGGFGYSRLIFLWFVDLNVVHLLWMSPPYQSESFLV